MNLPRAHLRSKLSAAAGFVSVSPAFLSRKLAHFRFHLCPRGRTAKKAELEVFRLGIAILARSSQTPPFV